MSEHYVAAIDQGTASSRCIVFDRAARIVSVAQKEHEQIFPRPGWVEHDPEEIWRNVVEVVQRRARRRVGCSASDLVALGITNQRETTVRVGPRRPARRCTTRSTGRTRAPTALVRELGGDVGQDRFRERCGLPLATYFSGPKLRWLLDTRARPARARRGAARCCSGRWTRWLIWKLTGRHLTDVTNASRTMLMDLETLDWDDELLDAIGVPRGDAARDPPLVGGLRRGARRRSRACRSPPRSATSRPRCSGRPASRPARPSAPTAPAASCCFNTGERAGRSPPTGCSRPSATASAPSRRPTRWRARSRSPARSCSGSATTSALIGSAPEIETLARTVEDNGGCYFVPAFSGLFAPHWRSDARGVIAGLTGYITKGHLARAVLEATAWQTREVVDAMNADARHAAAHACASTAA